MACDDGRIERSGLSQAQRQPRTGQQDDAIDKWRMAAQWCSWRMPPLPNAGCRMNSTGIASQDHASDSTVGSEPSLVMMGTADLSDQQ
jgi:hypothetical protein